LHQLAEDMLLQDLDESVVDFTENFDGSCSEPSVLPARIPQLLVNGSQGIAVGIATKIPPHNLREVVSACLALIKKPSMSDRELMEHVLGPDFPTGGILLSGPGIESTYGTGKGSMTIRSKVQIEKGASRDRDVIAITELPYQVYKASIIEEIANLVEKGTLTGIADIQDESDRQGMRIAIEVKKTSDPQVVLNNLFKHTRLQTRFSANMVALVDAVPEQMTLRRMLETFITFRFEVRHPFA
jgi:DNA gyrase subunit A